MSIERVNINVPICALPPEMFTLVISNLEPRDLWQLMQTCDLLWNCSRELFLELFTLFKPHTKRDYLSDENYRMHFEIWKHSLKTQVYYTNRFQQNRIDGVYALCYLTSTDLNSAFSNHPSLKNKKIITWADLDKISSTNIHENGVAFNLKLSEYKVISNYNTIPYNIPRQLAEISIDAALGIHSDYKTILQENACGIIPCNNGNVAFLQSDMGKNSKIFKNFHISYLNFNVSREEYFHNMVLKMPDLRYLSQKIKEQIKNEVCLLALSTREKLKWEEPIDRLRAICHLRYQEQMKTFQRLSPKDQNYVTNTLSRIGHEPHQSEDETARCDKCFADKEQAFWALFWDRELLHQFYQLTVAEQNTVYDQLHQLIDPTHSHPRHGELAFHWSEGFSSTFEQREAAIHIVQNKKLMQKFEELETEDKNGIYEELHILLNSHNTCPQHGEFAFHCLYGFHSDYPQRQIAWDDYFTAKREKAEKEAAEAKEAGNNS